MWIVATAAVIVFSVLFELVMGMSSVSAAAREGRSIDLVTPFVTLGLDFYRETATATLERLQALVIWTFQRAGHLWRLIPTIARIRKGTMQLLRSFPSPILRQRLRYLWQSRRKPKSPRRKFSATPQRRNIRGTAALDSVAATEEVPPDR